MQSLRRPTNTDGSAPFGPGGRPMGGIRPYLVLMWVITGVVILPVMLAERAPRLARDVSRWVDDSDSLLARVGGMIWLPDTAFEIHVLAWAVAALIAGLVAWSWPSLVALGLMTLVASLAVEAAQDILTDTRTSQVDDAVANSIGVAVGLCLAVAANVVWRGLVARRSPPGQDPR